MTFDDLGTDSCHKKVYFLQENIVGTRIVINIYRKGLIFNSYDPENIFKAKFNDIDLLISTSSQVITITPAALSITDSPSAKFFNDSDRLPRKHREYSDHIGVD